MNIIDQFTNAWKVFCRPPRQTYSIFDLGPPLFQTKNYKCKRQEFKVKNKRGFTLECSYYECVGVQNPECIIYLHCFNGSRIESIKFAEPSISRGCSFCSFDFSGSGLSEGEYVSLGYYEQDDVQVVVNHLRNQFNVKSIALWGRSMGAVTALLYTQKNPHEIQALAVDSAFVSMWDAGLEIADKKVSLPTFIIKGMLEYVRRQIKSNAGYDMDDVNTIKNINKCYMPVIFVVSKEDKLVSSENSQKLFESYPTNAKKTLLFVKGNHNECRDWEDVLKIADFISSAIKKERKSSENTPQNKENSHLIQVDQNNYNTPNNRDEQKQLNVIKVIKTQQQQQNQMHNIGIDQSPGQGNNYMNQKSPTGSVSSESPAHQLYKMPVSHVHTSQNQVHYIIHNNQQNTPSSSSQQQLSQHHHHAQHLSLSRPNSSLSAQPPQFEQSQFNQNQQQGMAVKKAMHQYSTSNITADHYKQFGQNPQDEKDQVIDDKEIQNNPLVQSLLKDLIQKNYSNDFKSNEFEQAQKQNPSQFYQTTQQSPQVNDSNLNFTSKLSDMEYKQQIVLNKGIQNLQQQLQVQQVQMNNNSQANQQPQQNSNPAFNNNLFLQSQTPQPIQLNNNQLIKNQNPLYISQQPSQNQLNIPFQETTQMAGSRKSSIVSPSNFDLKASNIPDEMHEIDFPKAKDFRTKQKISNYAFQMHPPGSTFSNQLVGMTEFGVPQGTPQHDASRKTSLLPENNFINSIPATQQSQVTITKLQEQYNSKSNHSAFTTINNSPQFFADKAGSPSPNNNSGKQQQQSQFGNNKNFSQVLIEEQINIPQQNSYPNSNSSLPQLQQLPGVSQQQQSSLSQQQLFQGNQTSSLQQPQLQQNNPQQQQVASHHYRQKSIQKTNMPSSQEEEDYHHLPQSTLTINLKQYF